MRHDEDDLHMACVSWCDWYFKRKFPHLMLNLIDSKKRPYSVSPLVYTKNEGKKTFAQAGRDKKKGLRSGYPDLKLEVSRVISDSMGAGLATNRFSPSMIIELKTKKGRIEQNQKAWREYMIGQGCLHVFCRSLEEFQAAVICYMEG